jgi:hypothetical protein
MNWFISLEQFDKLLTARPEPPYILWLAGLLSLIACTLPFVILVRHRMEYWAKNFSAHALPPQGKVQLVVPFSGMMGGLYVLTASSLEVLGIPILPSLFFSLLVIPLASYLTWRQLGRMLSRQALRYHLDEHYTPQL